MFESVCVVRAAGCKREERNQSRRGFHLRDSRAFETTHRKTMCLVPVGAFFYLISGIRERMKECWVEKKCSLTV